MKTMTAKRVLVIALLLFIGAAFVYFFQFTQLGYLLTVPDRTAFTEIDEHVYINQNNGQNQKEVLALVQEAKERVRAFFGDLRCLDETFIILCDDKNLTRKLGEDHGTVMCSFPFKISCVCVSDEYLELDVLAHELTHAELHARLSDKAYQGVPTWFHEGLATQNDDRPLYSEEEWLLQTDGGKNAVAREDMDTPDEFYAGTAEDRRFRYLNAKHEVAVWMEANGRQGLLLLLERLNDGADFSAAYGT